MNIQQIDDFLVWLEDNTYATDCNPFSTNRKRYWSTSGKLATRKSISENYAQMLEFIEQAKEQGVKPFTPKL